MKSQALIGIYLLIALIVLCVLPVVVFFVKIENDLVRTMCYVGASGGIGGTLYSIRGFYQNLGGGTFKMNWIWWYIFRPLISVVVGVFIYFLIVGGLMSISTDANVTFSKGVMFYCALAFLAGFSFTRFAGKLDTLSETVFSKQEKDTEEEKEKGKEKERGKEKETEKENTKDKVKDKEKITI